MVKIYVIDVSYLPDPKEDKAIIGLLDKDRKEKILRFRQVKNRKQCLGAGLLLKECLKEYNINIEDIRYGEHGKPEVEGIYFNISHSDDMVVCAVSEMPVGCDIEKVREERSSIAERFFTKNEVCYLNQCEENKRNQEFCRLWTIKESYMKMTGEGLSLALNQFEVEILDDNKVNIYRDGKICDCHINEYDIPGYKLAVCGKQKRFAHNINFSSKQISDSLLKKKDMFMLNN